MKLNIDSGKLSLLNIFVTQCEISGANKTLPKTPKAPLGKMSLGAPMDRLATDILGPLPLTERNNRYILVVTDYFSNWVDILPMPEGGGPEIVVSTAAFHARVQGLVPSLGGLKETNNVSSPSTCESQYCGEPP